MNDATSGLKKTVLRYAGILLALSLLAALWSTALARLSEESTAESLLTRAGTDILNPLLTANGSGIGGSFYQLLASQAQASPNKPLAIGFLKTPILGREIAGKNFADGSRVIYADIARAYYHNGPFTTFNLPAELQPLVNNYTPFTQLPSSVSSSLPNIPLPQLPSFATQLWSSVGITPTTLTAAGHATTTTNSLWLWGLSVVLALVLVALNTGWTRLWSVAWPIFHASWHIALIGLIATIVVRTHPTQAAPYMGVLGLIGSTFMVVFYVAALVGVLAVVVSLIGNRLSTQNAQPATASADAHQGATGFGASATSPAPAAYPAEPPMAPSAPEPAMPTQPDSNLSPQG
jgi:hypothetical protein